MLFVLLRETNNQVLLGLEPLTFEGKWEAPSQPPNHRTRIFEESWLWLDTQTRSDTIRLPESLLVQVGMTFRVLGMNRKGIRLKETTGILKGFRPLLEGTSPFSRMGST